MTETQTYAIESRTQKRMGEEVLWFRKTDNHWTHHVSRVQFYTAAEAKDIVSAMPPMNGRVVRIIPAANVSA